jgi:hypothetical protein
LACGSALRHLQADTRSKRSAALRSRVGRRLPVEAVQGNDQPLFLRPPDHVGHLHHGILHVGGDDLEILFIEGDELQWIHGTSHPGSISQT